MEMTTRDMLTVANVLVAFLREIYPEHYIVVANGTPSFKLTEDDKKALNSFMGGLLKDAFKACEDSVEDTINRFVAIHEIFNMQKKVLTLEVLSDNDGIFGFRLNFIENKKHHDRYDQHVTFNSATLELWGSNESMHSKYLCSRTWQLLQITKAVTTSLLPTLFPIGPLTEKDNYEGYCLAVPNDIQTKVDAFLADFDMSNVEAEVTVELAKQQAEWRSKFGKDEDEHDEEPVAKKARMF